MKSLHYLEIIKLLRHLWLACVIVCQQHPSSILRLVVAFKDGQGPGEKPILCPQPASTMKDSILEQIHSSGVECWFLAPSSGFRRLLTNALWAQELPRQLGSGEGRELHCIHSLEDQGRPTLAHTLPAPFQLAGPLNKLLSELRWKGLLDGQSYMHFILIMLPHFFLMLLDNTIRVTQIPKGEEQMELL